jgi:mono/diheme cytochrome c family protein
VSELNQPTPLKVFKADPTTRLAWSGFTRWRAPIWLMLSSVVFIVLTWLPIAIAIDMRTDKNKKEPRIHLIQDMDNQTKFRPQDENVLFLDNRADRGRVPGTVARGELYADGPYHNGYVDSYGADGKLTREFVTDFPDAVRQQFATEASARAFLNLGQQKFNMTCALCHGADGLGNGPIAIRAQEVGASATGWVQPSNLSDEVRRGRSDGHIYNTINNGIRKMGGYGHQLNVNERWAIVAYVRAIQLSQAAPKSVLTPEQQRALQ